MTMARMRWSVLALGAMVTMSCAAPSVSRTYRGPFLAKDRVGYVMAVANESTGSTTVLRIDGASWIGSLHQGEPPPLEMAEVYELPAGRHTFEVSWAGAGYQTISRSAHPVSVEFEVEAGRIYEIQSRMAADSKWQPVREDITDRMDDQEHPKRKRVVEAVHAYLAQHGR